MMLITKVKLMQLKPHMMLITKVKLIQSSEDTIAIAKATQAEKTK